MNRGQGRALAYSPLVAFLVLRHLRVFDPRQLLERQSRSLLHLIFPVVAVAGMFTTTLAALLTLAAANGVNITLREKLAGLDSHVLVESRDGIGIRRYDALAEKLRGVPSVVAVASFVRDTSSQIAVPGFEPYPIFLKGVDSEDERKATNLVQSIVEGNIDRFPVTEGADSDVPILMGYGTAKDLGLAVGSHFSIVRPGALSTRTLPASLVGIFRTDTSYDRNVAYIPLSRAQNLGAEKDPSVTGIAVKTADLYQSAATAVAIRQAIGDDFKVSDWQGLRPDVFSLVQLMRRLILIYQSLMFAVGILLVLSVVSAILNQRRKDIVMLLTLGLHPRLAQLTVALSGTVIGGLGIAVGAFAAGPISRYLMDHRVVSLPDATAMITFVPFALLPIHVAIIVFGELAVLFLCAWLATSGVARIKPAIELRFE